VKSERLSAVGRMASSIIHDIKNPMSTLRMYAQLMKRKAGGGELESMADEMIHQVDRFVKMTQEILDFSRGVSEVKLEKVNLVEVMDASLKFIAPDLEKRQIVLERNFEYTGECKLDIEKVMRVFYNLASNAADAMSEGGKISVTTSSSNGNVVIEFKDNGTGMTEEIRAKVFEPFYSHGKKHGTGLGLPIAKKIIDDHGGEIQISSAVSKGTTVRLLLPQS
jgi:signal transduction histidine kinase